MLRQGNTQAGVMHIGRQGWAVNNIIIKFIEQLFLSGTKIYIAGEG